MSLLFSHHFFDRMSVSAQDIDVLVTLAMRFVVPHSSGCSWIRYVFCLFSQISRVVRTLSLSTLGKLFCFFYLFKYSVKTLPFS